MVAAWMYRGGHVSQREGAFGDFVPPLLWGACIAIYKPNAQNIQTFIMMESTAWILTKFCILVKTSKYVSWVVQKLGK